MKEARTIEGQWYIFGDQKPACYGTLSLDTETGLSLDVKMPRPSEEMGCRSPFGEFNCPQTIHGYGGDAKRITLFACMGSQSSNLNALDTFHIRPLQGILGGHFECWSEINTQSVRANYSILDAWLRRSTITADKDSAFSTFTQRSIPAIEVPLTHGAQLIITCGYSQVHGIGDLHLTQQHTAHFNFNEAHSLSKMRSSHIHVFRNLLMFLTGSQVFIDRITFNGHSQSENELLNRNQGAGSARRELSFGRLVVHYHEIAHYFPETVTRWFEYQSTMEPVLSLYFTACWNLEMPGTTKFLLLAQALEAYHNRSTNYESAVQTTKDFRQRIIALVAAVPDDSEKAWLREKLNHANQKSLAQRLSDLIATHDKDIAQFIPDSSVFANSVRHTRNYFTHFDEELRRRGKIPEVTQLSKITIQMRALLEICFSRDLGLPEVAVQRIIARSKDIRFVSLETSPSNS